MHIDLNDAYNSKSPDDNKKLYAQWAKTYESEFVESQGYLHPQVIAEIFNSKIPSVRTVVDIGAGTGLVGMYLSNLRKEILIDGIDISPEMLEVAGEKQVYRNLYERDLTQSALQTSAPYDSLISIGIFTHGHLGPEALVNLLPLVRPEGYFVIAANKKYYQEHDFEKFLQTLPIKNLQMEDTQVYASTSAHRDSLNVVSIFQNN